MRSLLVLPLLLALTTPLLAQARIVDPFAKALPQDDWGSLDSLQGSRHEIRAAKAVDLSHKALPLRVTTVQLANQPFVLVRGWEGVGTGAGQITYSIFRPAGEDSVSRVWWAVATEYWPEESYPPKRQHSIRACLLLIGDQLAYEHSPVPRSGRGFDTPPLPKAGLYRWSEVASTFVWSGRLPLAAHRQCQRAPNLIAPAG